MKRFWFFVLGLFFFFGACIISAMRYETIYNLPLPKIGFGTANLGGSLFADHSRNASRLASLRSALELGYIHFDTAEMYGSGHAEELLGRAFRETNTKRANLFITSKVMPTHLHYDDVLKACEASLRRLGTDYLDLYLIHWPMLGMKLADTFRALNKLIKDGRVRHLGVSNFSLKLLKESQSHSETPIITNQVPYSLSHRSYVRNGMLKYCQANDILITAYSPMEVGRLKASPALSSVAEAHNATPYQIALAWLVSQPRVITIPISFDSQHQRENLLAADIVLTDEEINQLTKPA